MLDTDNHRIQVLDSDGSFIRKWEKTGGGIGNAPREFDHPKGITINSTGYVFIADSGNNRTQIFTAGGYYENVFGSFGSANGKFYEPTGIASNTSDYLYVVDKNNHRVQAFGPGGEYLQQWGSGSNANGKFNNPKAIAVNSTRIRLCRRYQQQPYPGHLALRRIRAQMGSIRAYRQPVLIPRRNCN